MSDMEKIMNDFEHEVNKAHGEGWDFVDLSTDDAKKILVLLKEQKQEIKRAYMRGYDKAWDEIGRG